MKAQTLQKQQLFDISLMKLCQAVDIDQIFIQRISIMLEFIWQNTKKQKATKVR